jgi:single-stranded-DNA-specific exonuclease
MASVGLAFYLMAALRTELRSSGHFTGRREPALSDLLDLVALGTLADLVPLRGENRILTATGLKQLTLRKRPGIAALLDRAGIALGRPVDERMVGWKLGPRLNAPGRLGDAEPALALLLAPDLSAAMGWAARLEDANSERRRLQDEVFAQALETLGEREPGPAVVIAGTGWPSGVVGIVAAKLVDMYQRPAFVIAVDPQSGRGQGSARTVPGVDLYQTLAQCAGMLERFGGHKAAAGLTVHQSRIDELRDALHQLVAGRKAGDPAGGVAQVDAEVNLGDVDERLCEELGSLAPFGKGNEEPLLVCRGMRVRGSRLVGNGIHLKLDVEDAHGVSRSGIGFGLAERDPGPGATIDAAFAPNVNEWGGRRRVELTFRRLSRS